MRPSTARTLVGVGLGVFLMMSTPSGAPSAPADPPEAGRVSWRRDYDAAAAEAATSGRPLFVQFQEIPGCGTCVGFGQAVLSHPLLVEAIESEFVPLLVRNNVKGAEAAVLRRFNEPAWNNPVVRFLDAAGHDLLPRKDGVWSSWEMAARMTAALGAAHRPAPAYLTLVGLERETGLESAVFAVHCFWEGERTLGGLDGVAETEAGFHDGAEVVTVRYDPALLPFAALLRAARSRAGATAVYTTTDAQARVARESRDLPAHPLAGAVRRAPDSDQKYTLRASPLHRLDLTPVQATKINAALAAGGDAAVFLSPRQRGASR